MLHLLFADGTTQDIEDAVSVTRDESTGITHCKNAHGREIAAFARGELLALSFKPFPPYILEAFRDDAQAVGSGERSA
jgi:hypothetical protein